MRGHGAVTFQTGISGYSVMGEYTGYSSKQIVQTDILQESDLETAAALWYAGHI